ncbi:MAG: CDP-archaeol synthase [Candidatus Omnitrophica bacterium]|nr:CDP-archaeol synthase [Candidatus Omnitrophota bacterium]MDD5487589.1 CDP-archaeol synthase [Candidatus Omnitrophota bacterium]
MSKFLRRTIVSAVLMAFVFAAIFRLPNWVFCVVICAFVACGLYEFFHMVEHRKIFVYKYFGTATGALIPVVIYMGNSLPEIKNLEPLLIVVGSLLALTLQFARRDDAGDHLISAALTLFGLFYIAWFFSFFVKIKFLPNGSELVMFLVLVTKSADMGAYVIGSRFGRRELIPRISPKKTVEGTLGGVATSVIISMISGKFLTGYSYAHLMVLGFMLALIGQVGDLAESLIKRNCNIKDSGAYLPGIGGVLDLLDSLLFTAPIFYFYVKTF